MSSSNSGIRLKMEKDVYAVLQLEAEERMQVRSPGEAAQWADHTDPCWSASDGLCRKRTNSPRRLQAVAAVAVFCVIRCGFHSSAVPTDPTQLSGSWRKGRRSPKPWAWGGAGSRPRKRGRRKKVCWEGSSKSQTWALPSGPVVPLLAPPKWLKTGLTQMPVCQCSLTLLTVAKGWKQPCPSSRCVGTQNAVYTYSGAYGYMGIWAYGYMRTQPAWSSGTRCKDEPWKHAIFV